MNATTGGGESLETPALQPATGSNHSCREPGYVSAGSLATWKELLDDVLKVGVGRNSHHLLAEFACATATLGIAAGKFAHQHGAPFGSEPGTHQAIVVDLPLTLPRF